MIKHLLTRQFLKFLAVGISAAAANWIACIIFRRWIDFAPAIIAAYFIGLIIAFILNKVFVFPKSTTALKKQIRDFALTNFVTFWLILGMSIFFKNLLENFGFTIYSAELAHLMALALPMIGSFLIYKFFAFKE